MAKVDIAQEALSGREFLAGGGVMGARMRSHDWSSTPLGRPEAWPQSLKTAVRILLTSRFAMWMAWGPELIFLCNDAYLPTTGLKRDWVLGARSDAVWSEIWPDIGPRIARVLLTGEATWDEALLLYLQRSGFTEETYHTLSYSPLADDGGATAGMLCVVAEVTERIIGERQLATLRDLGARLAAAATRTQSMRALEAALAGEPRDVPFALAYLTEGDNVARRAGLYGLHEGTSGTPHEVPLGGDAVSVWPLAEVLKTGTARILRLPDTLVDGLTRSCWEQPPSQALIMPIPDSEGGAPLGFLVAGLNPNRALDERYRGFINLLTGQIAAAIARADAFERERARAEALTELDRAKTVFFSNISHEFRTPLTLILNPVELLLAGGADNAQERALLDAVHRNALRLLKLVNALLDFSRIEAGRIQARYEPVDLALFTAELASAFRSVVEQAGLQLEVNASQLAEAVFIDRDMWEKVVLNLVSNAFKFTFAGRIDVRVTASADDRGAIVTVSDTGSGIPEDEVPRLFERFHQVPGARGRSIEGSGIGLALVKELVGLHGGAIAVDSTPGRGTSFTITLPFGSAHLPREQVYRDATQAVPVRVQSFVTEARRWLPDGPGKDFDPEPAPRWLGVTGRVLVADDNADMRSYVERLLRDAGLMVESVADGSMMLEAARAAPPDLVLSDVMMPGMDGFALLSALRAARSTRDLPVILLSARAGEEARVAALQAGADDYLVKPFSARELVASVARAVRLSQLRRATEIRNEGQRQILELIASGMPLDRTLDEIAAYVETQEPDAIVSILVAGKDEERFLVSRGPSLPGSFHTVIERLSKEPPFMGTCPEALGRCDAVSVSNVATDSRYAPLWRECLISHSLRSVRSTPVLDASGRPIASLAIYYPSERDPTPADQGIIDIGIHLISIALERAHSEEALTESSARLEQLNAELEQRVADALAERKLFADIVEGTDAFVQVVDANFRWLAINRAAADEFEAIFGERPKVGASMLETLAGQPEHRDAVRALWARALAGDEFTTVRTFGNPERARHTYEIKFNTLHDAYGRIVGAYQFVQDVTARIENERRLAEAQGQLHEMQKLETIGQLTGGIAHDFNNLLTPIYGALDTLQRRYRSDERVSRLINGALQAAERAGTLVGRLLTFARRQDLEARPVAIPELVRGMLELIVRSLGPTVEVTVETAPDLPMAQIDPNQLELALLNLCVNARDAMSRGGKLQIAADDVMVAEGTVAGLSANRYVRLQVTDTGAGMDAETLRHAIEPFFTTKGMGRGTGLGLSMVHGLAAQSGGALTLESSLGEGTTATLYLPLASQAYSVPTREAKTAPSLSRSLVILLVDDEELVRLGLRAMLEGLDHRVIEAASGSAASQQLVSEPEIELLITDYMMPGMTGIELVREARRLRPELPALLMTGYANLQSALPENLSRIGKPFVAAELANAISVALADGKVCPLAARRETRLAGGLSGL